MDDECGGNRRRQIVREDTDENSTESDDEQENLRTILEEAKRMNQDREVHTNPSSGTYNMGSDDASGGEELEMIAVWRKPFRQMSCNSNIRTNLEPEINRENLSKIVGVKFCDDIHNPGKMTGRIMALKENVKSRYRLSDLIRAQKNDKMTSHLFRWIRTGVKEKEDLEEDGYKILSQFYKERKGLLYHMADG